jgi:hypothetical protein
MPDAGIPKNGCFLLGIEDFGRGGPSPNALSQTRKMKKDLHPPPIALAFQKARLSIGLRKE